MYSFESKVRYSECDQDGNLSIDALVNYLQDCSTFQSEELGVGIDFLREHHFAWFLGAWQIWIDRLPRFCEPIRISTWSCGIRRVDAHRNFVIDTLDGTRCVKADSFWFVYDTELHRPIRIPASEKVYDQGDTPLDLPPTPRKIEAEGPYTLGVPVVVGPAHLDTNGHVNNAQYVRLALDAVPELPAISRLLVSYRQMALEGDTIVPHVHTSSDASLTIDLANPNGDSYAVIQLYTRNKEH